MLSFLFVNVLLFVGTYLAGCVPISVNFQPAKLRLLTIFGAGLLLGAALVIIIPEGVDSLYAGLHRAVPHTPNSHGHSAGSDPKENVPVRAVRDTYPRIPMGQENRPAGKAPDEPALSLASASSDGTTSSDPSLPLGFLSASQHIGFALLFGYLFMLLIDHLVEPVVESRCCAWTISRFFVRSPCCHISISGNNGNVSLSNSAATNPSGVRSTGRRRITATVGFVFHSLADGLALGAAFSVDQLRLELILFFAIFLHKIPAAFGLCCYLIHEGFPRSHIRLHMLVFALTSPIAALLTYIYLTWSSATSVTSDATTKTGFALLLSGGTFLYVAASHVLPELVQSHASHSTNNDVLVSQPPEPADYTLYTMSSQDPILVQTNPNSASSCKSTTVTPRLQLLDLCVLIFGSMVPFFLSVGHHH